MRVLTAIKQKSYDPNDLINCPIKTIHVVLHWFIFPDGSFVLEASTEEEKYKWMLLIHFAKSRLENNPVPEEEEEEHGSGRSAARKSDFLLVATERISQKSNKTIDELFVNMENEKSSKYFH